MADDTKSPKNATSAVPSADQIASFFASDPIGRVIHARLSVLEKIAAKFHAGDLLDFAAETAREHAGDEPGDSAGA